MTRLLTLAFLGLAACGAGRSSGIREENPVVKERWALLYYGMGDNNLAEDLVSDVHELERRSSSSSLILAGQLDVDNVNVDVSDRRFFVKGRAAGIPTGASFDNPVEEFEELDSGSPETLREFLIWAHEAVPADRFILVLSGHGYGYSAKVRGESMGAPVPGVRYFSFDLSPLANIERNSGKSVLTTTELAQVLHGFRKPDGTPWVDVLVADSCVSQTFENAYAFRSATSFYVASQEAERASGHDWARTLDALENETRRLDPFTRQPVPLTPERASVAIVQGYASQNLNNSQLSAIAVNRLEPLRDALAALAMEARPRALEVEKWLTSTAKFFGGVLAPRIWTDLWRLASEWEWAGIVSQESASRVRDALEDAVVGHKATGRGSVGNAHGLSLTFPGRTKVRDPQSERGSLEWEIQVELGTDESEVTQGPVADLLHFIHCRGELGCHFGPEVFRYDEGMASLQPWH